MNHHRSGERRALEGFKQVSHFSTEQEINEKNKYYAILSVGITTPMLFSLNLDLSYTEDECFAFLFMWF